MKTQKTESVKQEFVIAKSYEGTPSKNQPIYHKVNGWEEAVSYLAGLRHSWIRNGGMVLSESESVLVVEESDGSEVITFKIKES